MGAERLNENVKKMIGGASVALFTHHLVGWYLMQKKGRAIAAPAFFGFSVLRTLYFVVAKVKLPTRKLLLGRQICTV